MNQLLQSRKSIAFLVSAASMMLLKRFGMSPEDLSSTYGITLSELQETAIDALMTVVLPAWFGWAWPNDPKRGIFDYWRVFLSGVAAIGAGAFLVWWL